MLANLGERIARVVGALDTPRPVIEPEAYRGYVVPAQYRLAESVWGTFRVERLASDGSWLQVWPWIAGAAIERGAAEEELARLRKVVALKAEHGGEWWPVETKEGDDGTK